MRSIIILDFKKHLFAAVRLFFSEEYYSFDREVIIPVVLYLGTLTVTMNPAFLNFTGPIFHLPSPARAGRKGGTLRTWLSTNSKGYWKMMIEPFDTSIPLVVANDQSITFQ
jgi:hypothetical protein